MSNDDRMGAGIVAIGVVFLLGMAGKGHVGRMASRGRSRARKAVAGGRTNRFRRRLERTGRW